MNIFENPLGPILLMLAGLIILGFVGSSDVTEQERQQAHYCAMADMWDATAGKHGWPAYRGREVCRD